MHNIILISPIFCLPRSTSYNEIKSYKNNKSSSSLPAYLKDKKNLITQMPHY